MLNSEDGTFLDISSGFHVCNCIRKEDKFAWIFAVGWQRWIFIRNVCKTRQISNCTLISDVNNNNSQCNKFLLLYWSLKCEKICKSQNLRDIYRFGNRCQCLKNEFIKMLLQYFHVWVSSTKIKSRDLINCTKRWGKYIFPWQSFYIINI